MSDKAKYISHHTVLQQVRKNLTTELIDNQHLSARHRNDLIKFLAFEPVEMTPDIYNKLADKGFSRTMIGRVRVPVLQVFNPKPRFYMWSKFGIFGYAYQWAWYIALALFIPVLKRCIWMHDEIQAFQISEVNVLDPESHSEQS
jgi:hypothetical protein